MAESYAHLKDFDWSLRVRVPSSPLYFFSDLPFFSVQLVLSSDKISGLRKPILMLNLETVDSNGTNQNQLIELTNEELKEFIDKLKTAQKVTQIPRHRQNLKEIC